LTFGTKNTTMSLIYVCGSNKVVIRKTRNLRLGRDNAGNKKTLELLGKPPKSQTPQANGDLWGV